MSDHAAEMNDAEAKGLAERLAEMREEKRYLEEQIVVVSDRLAALLGPGTRVQIGPFRVRVGEPRPSLRVLDAGLVPDEFLSRQPDRARIRTHIETSGESVAGVSFEPGRPIVYVTSADEG